MKGKEEIVEVIISRLDLYIIEKVKKLREDRGWSQDNLSTKMGLSEKYIGSVENPRLKAHYNIRQLNLLANALECKFSDLLPSHPFEEDLIKVKIKRIRGVNKDGTKSKRITSEIIGLYPVKKVS